MKSKQNAAPSDWRYGVADPHPLRRYSTGELAALFKVKAQTVREGYCRNGHYQGLTPVKCPNRFLLWDADAAERLLSGEVVK